MRILALAWLVAGLWLGLSVQQDYEQGKNGVWWIYPSEGLIFQPLDVVNVSYRSPFTNPNLYIFCNLNGATYQQRMQPAPPIDGWVLVNINFTVVEACWFNLRPGTDAEGGSNSARFGVTVEPRSYLTTLGAALPVASTTAGGSSQGSNSTVSVGGTPSATATGAAAGAGDSGSAAAASTSELTAGAKAGIGVGAAVGSVALLTLVFFLGRRSSRRGKGGDGDGDGLAEKDTNDVRVEAPTEQQSPQSQHQNPYHEQQQQQQGQGQVVKQEIDGYAVSPKAELGEAPSPHSHMAELHGGEPDGVDQTWAPANRNS